VQSFVFDDFYEFGSWREGHKGDFSSGKYDLQRIVVDIEVLDTTKYRYKARCEHCKRWFVVVNGRTLCPLCAKR